MHFKTVCNKRKAFLTLGFFFIFCFGINSQNQRRLDSLESVYVSRKYDQRDKLEILKELAMNLTDSEKKLFFSEALIQNARAMDSMNYLFQGLMEKGSALRLKSDLTEALETYFLGAKLVGEQKHSRQLGVLHTGIADVYAIMGNHANAFKYYQSAIRILREAKDSLNEANALSNIGDLHANMGQLDSALSYTREAEAIFKKIKYKLGLAYTLGNTGMIYAKMGNNLGAEENMNEAIKLLEDLHEYYPIAVYLKFIADIYLEKGDEHTALNYAFESLELAHQYGMKKEVSEAYLQLSKIYEHAGKLPESYQYYKNHITYKDSVNNIVSVQ